MSFDRDRVLRRLKAYERARDDLRRAPTAGISEWEEWAIAWRIAADQTEGYARRNKMIAAQLEELVSERRKDPGLIYVWESGNAERHNPDGSAVPLQAVTINAADPTRPVVLDQLRIVNGQIVASVGSNVMVEHHRGVRLMPIKIRGGERAPPLGATVHTLVETGDAYLTALRRTVFPI